MRWPRALALLAPLAAAGCAGPQPQGEAAPEALAGMAGGPPQSCVPADDITPLRILDARTVAYESGPTLWVSRLPRDCPGLRRGDRLAVEMHGREYCRDDRFRTISPGSALPGPVCTLGDFLPYRRRP